MGIRSFFRGGGRLAWSLIGAVILILGTSTALLARAMDVRFRRDVTQMVFNDNVEVLSDVKKRLGFVNDSLDATLSASPDAASDKPYLVVSLAENRLWYKQGDRVLFETRVATGSGKTLVRSAGGEDWKFDTPRGRLVVERKEEDPVWVPPDWHYIEEAAKRKLRPLKLNRGEAVPTPDGGVIAVEGNDVVKRMPDGTVTAYDVTEGQEIISGGSVIIPPFGTNQRKYKGILGTHRLNLGDGYGIHGTNKPETIGRSVSHGCIRVRNEDIELLYRIVPVGTAVYIY